MLFDDVYIATQNNKTKQTNDNISVNHWVFHRRRGMWRTGDVPFFSLIVTQRLLWHFTNSSFVGLESSEITSKTQVGRKLTWVPKDVTGTIGTRVLREVTEPCTFGDPEKMSELSLPLYKIFFLRRLDRTVYPSTLVSSWHFIGYNNTLF